MKTSEQATIAVHHTATANDSWDAGVAEKALGADPSEAVLRSMYAWVDPDADPGTKAAYKMPHHDVSDGKVGAANQQACSAVVGVLNGGSGGTDIPDGDRQAVYDHVAAHLKDAGVDEVPKLEAKKAAARNAATSGLTKLAEVGRVLSAANEEKLRTAIANLSSILDALGSNDDDQTEEAAKKAEAFSSSAWDAASGAYLLGSLLDLISDESDEPDQVAMLKTAFDAISQWIAAEVAEIGSDDDQADSEASPWGWESMRRLIPAESTRVREGKAIRGDVVQLLEASVRDDGTVPLKLIQPGWGSSGYYSAEVLERDGPKVFAAGTKQFWDHSTITEDIEQPERSLRDLAAVLVSDAAYDPAGPAGPGLYAEAKVFSEYAAAVDELAPYIGVSIATLAQASQGEAEGRRGVIIERLIPDPLNSCDYVTTPGAGGQVLQLFEAARQRQHTKTREVVMDEQATARLKEAERQRDEHRQRADRAEEAIILRDTRDFVAGKLGAIAMPDITKSRLSEVLTKNPPVKDGKLDQEMLGKKVDEAVKQEIDYLAKATGLGQVRGFGGPGNTIPLVNGDDDKELVGAFAALGLSESAARTAAKGRQ